MTQCCESPYITWASDGNELCTIFCHGCRTIIEEGIAVYEAAAKLTDYRIGDYAEQQLDMFAG